MHGLKRKEHYMIDIYDAMHLSISAWNNVSGTTISNVFQHRGFIKEIDIPEEFHDNTSYNFSKDELLIHELRRRKMQLPENSSQDFLDMDSNIIYMEEILDDAVINNLINENEIELSDQEEEKK